MLLNLKIIWLMKKKCVLFLHSAFIFCNKLVPT